MKSLTLTQPWATLVAVGAKRIETRSWGTTYRGPLAIHAAKAFPKWAREFSKQATCVDAIFKVYPSFFPLDERGFIRNGGTFPLGHVLAMCRLTDCLPTESVVCLPGVFDEYPALDTEQERAFGDYSPRRFAWILEDIRPLPEPIPAKGARQIWEWEAGHVGLWEREK